MPSWLKASELTKDQRANIATIIRVGRQVGASERDIIIALSVAAQESEFKNINYGDSYGPDSRGLYQQRSPWAPLADRMNPAKAALMFFTGGQGGQRGLLDFKNREQMTMSRAGNAVQVSRYPDAYAKHEDLARELLGTTAVPAASRTEARASLAVPPTVAPTLGSLGETASAGEMAHDAAIAARGVTAATATGVEAPGVPGIGSQEPTDTATPAPALTAAGPGPGYEFPVLDRTRFAALFPDAGKTKMFTAAGGDQRRADLVANAMSYLGTPYSWGGNSRDGIDCSGLVQQVYKAMGVDVPRLSADQARAGTQVAIKDLQPGDLVSWDNSARNNGADHISIYVGNGYIVEAPRPGLAVRKRKLGGSYDRNAVGTHFTQF